MSTINILSGFWYAYNGEHPENSSAKSLFEFPPFFDDDSVPEHLDEFLLPLVPCTDGHNVMSNNTYSELLDIETKVPISPNFVRDLAGRIIYIGYGPERKDPSQWLANPNATFPKNCKYVVDTIKGADLIGEVFFARFRCLDAGLSFQDNPLHNHPENKAPYTYSAMNLYPYKLRLDSFYIDGWKLPQTELLFARREGVNLHKANKIGEEFMEVWHKRTKDQGYESFYDQHNGDKWYEEMFHQGCTVIPTVEGHNGFHKINDDFTLDDYYSGRAVESLHKVVNKIPNEAPEGTILEVVEPGYMTHHYLHRAQVIVSDGEEYNQEYLKLSQALSPDFKLPHQRTASNYGAVWIPTKPHHFNAPAIWGWDKYTQHFMQFSGPVWDALHYYYESVPLVIEAFKSPLEECRNLAMVPENMKNRFYPVIGMKGFDMTSEKIKEKREEDKIKPNSRVVHLENNIKSCEIGYHPLPIQFEYELDGFIFPHLNPKQRKIVGTVPKNENLAQVIQSQVSEMDYLSEVDELSDQDLLTSLHLLQDSKKDVLADYPQLVKYLSDDADLVNSAENALYLSSYIVDNLSEGTEVDKDSLWPSIDGLEEATQILFYGAVDEFRDISMKKMYAWSNLYLNSYSEYLSKQWSGESISVKD